MVVMKRCAGGKLALAEPVCRFCIPMQSGHDEIDHGRDSVRKVVPVCARDVLSAGLVLIHIVFRL